MTSTASVLARVDRLLARAVELSSSAQTADGETRGFDPLRGLFVSDADAVRLVHREPTLGAALHAERPLVELHAHETWRQTAEVFGLSQAEVDTLALALAGEIDLRYERIFGYLHDDLTRRRLTPDLICQLLCHSFDERLRARDLFAVDAPLVRYGLIHLVPEPGQTSPSAVGLGIKCDEGITEFLLGGRRVDRRVAGVVRWVNTEGEAAGAANGDLALLREMRTARDGECHFVFAGPDTRLKFDLARRMARELGQPLLVADVARLEQLEVPFAEATTIVARAARLWQALIFWTGCDRLFGGDAESVARLESWLDAVDTFRVGATMLGASETTMRSGEHGARFLPVELPMPDAADRQRIWTRELRARGITIPAAETELLGEVFRIEDSAIDRAVGRAVADARRRDGAGQVVTTSDLFAAARAQILRSLPRYASRVPPGPRWDDIVLPSDHLCQLRELCERVRHRRVVLDEWGFGERLTLGRGIAALFAGPSGTGKTMAAQIIAATLGMDLYRVEIPAVVSKYIGETEKALDQLFREAQGTSVILFFDEADALFGKRSEVKDAHDRYANIEISYLLQAIEQYDGLTILATNLRHNVDDAFARRLAFCVTFPMPEEPERQRIWEKSWPSRVPLGGDIDVPFLAKQFKLAGGNIRNVALSAAFSAAANGGRVSMAHIVRGVRREFQKMGKTCVESDFGRYYPLLTDVA